MSGNAGIGINEMRLHADASGGQARVSHLVPHEVRGSNVVIDGVAPGSPEPVVASHGCRQSSGCARRAVATSRDALPHVAADALLAWSTISVQRCGGDRHTVGVNLLYQRGFPF